MVGLDQQSAPKQFNNEVPSHMWFWLIIKLVRKANYLTNFDHDFEVSILGILPLGTNTESGWKYQTIHHGPTNMDKCFWPYFTDSPDRTGARCRDKPDDTTTRPDCESKSRSVL